MDWDKTHLLMDRYFEGETTLEEEASLRRLFNSAAEIPEDLKKYQPLFTYFEQSQHTVFPTTKKPFSKQFLPWIAVAASVLIIFAIPFKSQQQTPDEQQLQQAYEELRSNMNVMSTYLNKGKKQLAYLEVWNQTTQKFIK